MGGGAVADGVTFQPVLVGIGSGDCRPFAASISTPTLSEISRRVFAS